MRLERFGVRVEDVGFSDEGVGLTDRHDRPPRPTYRPDRSPLHTSLRRFSCAELVSGVLGMNTIILAYVDHTDIYIVILQTFVGLEFAFPEHRWKNHDQIVFVVRCFV